MECSPTPLDFGHQLGTRHVLKCQLAPDTIRNLLELQGRERFDSNHIATIENALGADLAELDKLAAPKEKLDRQSHPAWRVAVYRGYVAGVADTWRQICHRMYPDDGR
ncbi:MAG: hypothetical protein ACC645_05980 [Pirellulales bacterium]